MKFLALAVLMLSSTLSFASNSYNPRHIKAIENAILTKCGRFEDVYMVSSTERVHRVDNGIRDVYYVTVYSGLQNADRVKIKVWSDYADMYDHTAQDWGYYSVSQVECSLE